MEIRFSKRALLIAYAEKQFQPSIAYFLHFREYKELTLTIKTEK